MELITYVKDLNLKIRDVIAIFALLLSLVSFIRSGRSDKRSLVAEKISNEVKIDTLLHDAWDLLGGNIKSGSINKFSDRESINKAKRLIDECLKYNRHYAKTYRILGLYYEAHVSSNIEKAETSYREAIKLDPQFALAHNNLGILLSDLKRQDEAEASYCEAIKLDPQFALAHNNLGNLLSDLKRQDEAEASYREAIKLDPQFTLAHNNLKALLSSDRQE